MKTLRFEVEISDEQAAALEAIKPFLIEDDYGNLTEESTLEEVYAECSERGLSLLTKKMWRKGLNMFEVMEDWEKRGKYMVGVPAWEQPKKEAVA